MYLVFKENIESVNKEFIYNKNYWKITQTY